MLNKLTEELAVCGYNAAAALAEYHPEKINRLFLREDRLRQFAKLCKNLAERKRPYKLCEDAELERICKSSHHQGVVIMIEEPVVAWAVPEDIDVWAQGKTGLVLHSVGNDHNLGAMVRSAAFFDAHFVVISNADTEARLTTSAYRVAEGGMEHVCFRRVKSTVNFLKALSKQVITVGTDTRARLRIRDLRAIIHEKAPVLRAEKPGVAIVVGNEESGLPPEVQEHCAAIVRIPGIGNIESLNVAQAATIFLHELYEL
ncbi:MAG: RNA methyltransferase [Spirochaetaceae bacterium]|jgi:TrmH RNA methyltransferase|nr:RNA methyltransferase [Spirochaetaceae bacterium]